MNLDTKEPEMKLWDVDDGEETHSVIAADQNDAIQVLEETWGKATVLEYQEQGLFQVTEVTEAAAKRCSFRHDDDASITTLWAAWQASPERGLIGSTDF